MKLLTIAAAVLVPILAIGKETTQLTQGFAHWIAEEFEDEPSNPERLNQDADPDQDGLSNLMEYALDTDPLFPSNRLPMSLKVDATGITYTYSADTSKSDIRYQVEMSRDLRTWSRVDSETLKAKGSIEVRAAKVSMSNEPVFVRLTVRPANLD